MKAFAHQVPGYLKPPTASWRRGWAGGLSLRTGTGRRPDARPAMLQGLIPYTVFMAPRAGGVGSSRRRLKAQRCPIAAQAVVRIDGGHFLNAPQSRVGRNDDGCDAHAPALKDRRRLQDLASKLSCMDPRAGGRGGRIRAGCVQRPIQIGISHRRLSSVQGEDDRGEVRRQA